MEIIKTSHDLSPQEVYLLTMNPETQKMKDAVSQEIEVTAWCLYKDVNSNGVEQEILSIETPEKEVFATNSETFKADFEKMLTLFAGYGSQVNAIKVTSGKSKAGRDFITCVYVR